MERHTKSEALDIIFVRTRDARLKWDTIKGDPLQSFDKFLQEIEHLQLHLVSDPVPVTGTDSGRLTSRPRSTTDETGKRGFTAALPTKSSKRRSLRADSTEVKNALNSGSSTPNDKSQPNSPRHIDNLHAHEGGTEVLKRIISASSLSTQEILPNLALFVIYMVDDVKKTVPRNDAILSEVIDKMCQTRGIPVESRSEYLCLSSINGEQIDISKPISSLETGAVIYTRKSELHQFQFQQHSNSVSGEGKEKEKKAKRSSRSFAANSLRLVSDLATSTDKEKEKEKGDFSDGEGEPTLKKPSHKFYNKSSDSKSEGKKDKEEKEKEKEKDREKESKGENKETHVVFDLGRPALKSNIFTIYMSEDDKKSVPKNDTILADIIAKICLARDITDEARQSYSCVSVGTKETIDLTKPLSSLETNAVIFATKERLKEMSKGTFLPGADSTVRLNKSQSIKDSQHAVAVPLQRMPDRKPDAVFKNPIVSDKAFLPVLSMTADFHFSKWVTYKYKVQDLAPLLGFTITVSAILNETSDEKKLRQSTVTSDAGTYNFHKLTPIYKNVFYNQVHYNWICLHPDEEVVETILPYSILSAYQIDWMTFHILEMTALDCREYQLVLKEKLRLSKKQVLHEILQRDSVMTKYHIQGLKESQPILESILKLEEMKLIRVSKKNIGFLVRKPGQNSLEEILQNKGVSERCQQFLAAIGAKGPTSESGERKSQWQGINYTWYIGPEMTQDAIRRLIGNAANVIIFNDFDSSEPFDPSVLKLGQMSHSICVAQPVENNLYRLGFFLNYTTKSLKDISHSEHDRELAVKKVRVISIEPPLAPNSLFDEKTLQDFVLTKFYNATIAAECNHEGIKRQFELPIKRLIQDLVVENLIDFHTKMVKLCDERSTV